MVPPRVITYSRVVHLSHVLALGMPGWPGDPPLELTTVAELDTHGYRLRRVAIGEHSGTHANAAASFSSDGEGIDQLVADRLVVPAVVVDARAAADRDPDYLLTADDLATWERRHGRVPAGSLVLLHTGWAARWGEPPRFLDTGTDGRMHFPGFGGEAVDVLLDERGVTGLGIDTHGVDGGCDDTFRVNRRVLERPRLVLECLANLDQLPPTGATLIVGVLRLRDGTGSPAAVLALIP